MRYIVGILFSVLLLMTISCDTGIQEPTKSIDIFHKDVSTYFVKKKDVTSNMIIMKKIKYTDNVLVVIQNQTLLKALKSSVESNGEISICSADVKYQPLWNNIRVRSHLVERLFRVRRVFDDIERQTIIVYHIDTGIDPTHPAIQHANCLFSMGHNFVSGRDEAYDDQGHGTWTAGIIAAKGYHIRGMCPNYVQFISAKVLDRYGVGQWSYLADALVYALDLITYKVDIKIINMSLGGDEPPSVIYQLLHQLREKGVVIVAATGNSGEMAFPAKFHDVISVGAQDEDEEIPSWSGTDPDSLLDFVAPGVKIKSAYLYDQYRTMSGTSAAAPHVTGITAILLSLGMPSNAVRDFMHKTTYDIHPVGYDIRTGFGLIDAYESVIIWLDD